MTQLKRLLCDEEGAAAIQYALVAGALCVAVLASGFALRGPLTDLYDVMANEANAALQVQPAAGPAPENGG